MIHNASSCSGVSYLTWIYGANWKGGLPGKSNKTSKIAVPERDNSIRKVWQNYRRTRTRGRFSKYSSLDACSLALGAYNRNGFRRTYFYHILFINSALRGARSPGMCYLSRVLDTFRASARHVRRWNCSRIFQGVRSAKAEVAVYYIQLLEISTEAIVAHKVEIDTCHACPKDNQMMIKGVKEDSALKQSRIVLFHVINM